MQNGSQPSSESAIVAIPLPQQISSTSIPAKSALPDCSIVFKSVVSLSTRDSENISENGFFEDMHRSHSILFTSMIE
jgi:hypothetical protein